MCCKVTQQQLVALLVTWCFLVQECRTINNKPCVAAGAADIIAAML
jgi:hypothetical protein